MNTKTKNPSTCFMEWEGSTGRFRSWNKETNSYDYVDAPFTFVVLDELSTVKGWSDKHKSKIWSNEVRSILEPLNIQTSEGSLAKGRYFDIKRKLAGIRYCQSVYIAFKNQRQELVLGNLQLKGSALSAWIDFVSGRNLVGKAVSFRSRAKKRKGANVYFSPLFCDKVPSAETLKKARPIYRVLQTYLESYLARQATF